MTALRNKRACFLRHELTFQSKAVEDIVKAVDLYFFLLVAVWLLKKESSVLELLPPYLGVTIFFTDTAQIV